MNRRVVLGIVLDHAVWHLVVSSGFLTLWVFNDYRFHAGNRRPREGLA